jgi:hypothetical protein
MFDLTGKTALVTGRPASAARSRVLHQQGAPLRSEHGARCSISSPVRSRTASTCSLAIPTRRGRGAGAEGGRSDGHHPGG